MLDESAYQPKLNEFNSLLATLACVWISLLDSIIEHFFHFVLLSLLDEILKIRKLTSSLDTS